MPSKWENVPQVEHKYWGGLVLQTKPAAPLTFCFPSLRWLGWTSAAVFTHLKRHGDHTDCVFFHLPCTSAFMGSGCSSLFLPNSSPVSISSCKNPFLCSAPAAPAAVAVRSPPVWAKNSSFLLHIKIRSKCKASYWLVVYRLTIYKSWSLIPTTYTTILARSPSN